MTWNVEGLARNIHSLKSFTQNHFPDFIFLSEPLIFQHDLDLVMSHLNGEYNYSLNSDDKTDPELPLIQNKATGGSMMLWKVCHDPYITVHPTSSSSFLPVIFSPPDCAVSIHVSIYLPTSGKETQFIEELAQLSQCLNELLDLYPEAPIYLRGDFNVSEGNTKRTALFSHFSTEHDLDETFIPHKTYHHFLGNGNSDSTLDKLVFSSTIKYPETLVQLHCKLSNPAIDSHHDMIISSFKLPLTPAQPASDENVTAPKIENNRVRVIWTDGGIENYQRYVVPELQRIQTLWLSPPTNSKTSLSLLLSATNNILSSSAKLTNKTILLKQNDAPRSRSTPLQIRQSANQLLKLHKELRAAESSASPNLLKMRADYVSSRSQHRKLVRTHKASQAASRDSSLLKVFSKDPAPFYKKIKRVKRGKCSKIKTLKVGRKTYHDDCVSDGFFDSISSLKTRNSLTLQSQEIFSEFSNDYENILKICQHGSKIPAISEKDAFDLLHKMKPDVNDFFSITPNHYRYAGPAGWTHFYLLLALLIDIVNNTDIIEINTVYACVLFKGHNKDKTSDRSYRTISTCPVIAKALDMYVRDLNIHIWNMNQAETQFQGEGSSHELAALLVTECIQHSLHHLKQPIFLLFLDAKSAYDYVLKELLIKNLYFAGTSGDTLLYLDKRLENRQTYLDWNGDLMGPILDEQGTEQGGVNSTDFYKIFGKEQLSSAQSSSLGVPLGPLSISGIGQADDTALVANSIKDLMNLLHLTTVFCAKYQVQLCSDKTKLLVYHRKDDREEVEYIKGTNPITINSEHIEFTDSAEHVGLVRSSAGNLPTLLARIIAHKNALGAVLHTGMARAHRGNPAASLRIQQMYANSVLFSGLGSLVLNDQEVAMITQHHKKTISNLQRLIPLTPRAVIFFLAGTLPGEAFLHLRQLSIFGMLCRLPSNVLNIHAQNIFNFITSSPKSWFHQIRDLCLKYGLQHPAMLLNNPPEKEAFKNLVKKHVMNYWEQKLRGEAEPLDSLEFFHPSFMSLTCPHPLWRTAAASPTKVLMATQQARFLSGRYRTEALCSNWSQNSNGHCKLSSDCQTLEDTRHILQTCSALAATREKLMKFTSSYCKSHSMVASLLQQYCDPECRLFCQFIIDCSVLPEVIASVQNHGELILEHLFNVTRIWIYTLHRDRLKMLGRWRNFGKV